jgi:tetratricopeptide (TPR) repeat protein
MLSANWVIRGQSPPQEPPEEDVSAAEKQVYVLNPLQSEKELKIGKFYFRKGSYKAAARRFEEAAKWDPNSAEAFFRLGEAQSKLGNKEAAAKAWKKCLEIDPDGKQADDARKKLAKS